MLRMSFGKSRVERFNYYPTPANPSTRSGTILSASLPSTSAFTLSVSGGPSQFTPIKSGRMSSQHSQRLVKRNIPKCSSTGAKGKLTSQRIPTTPLILSRSNRVVKPRTGAALALRIGRISSNGIHTASRKSGTLKRKTSRKSKTADRLETSVTCAVSSLDIFHTPLSSPRESEYGDGAQTARSQTAEEERQQEPELQIKPNYELFSITNPSSANSPSKALSPPLHESTLVLTKQEECSEKVYDADEPVSVTTPGRTPRRLTNGPNRGSTPNQLENINSLRSTPSRAPLRRNSSSTPTVERTDANSIPTERRVSLRGYQNRSPQAVSPQSCGRQNRSINSGTKTITVGWIYPVRRQRLRDEEPLPPPLPRPLRASAIAEGDWPLWPLPISNPDPISVRWPLVSWDRDVELGKYHKPIVIASSFYNWVMDRLFRPDRNTKRKHFYGRKRPEPVLNSLSNIYLSKMLRTGLHPMRQQKRHAIKENQVQEKAACDFGERVKTAQFWIPLVEFVVGQVVAEVLSSIPSLK